MPKLITCKRCERNFAEDGINPDGLCNSCHCDYMPQWAIDLARRLMELLELYADELSNLRLGLTTDAMPTQDERIIYAAFDRHIRDLHPAQFEVCHDPGCAAARMIEESAMCYPKPQFDPWFVEETVEATE